MFLHIFSKYISYIQRFFVSLVFSFRGKNFLEKAIMKYKLFDIFREKKKNYLKLAISYAIFLVVILNLGI